MRIIPLILALLFLFPPPAVSDEIYGESSPRIYQRQNYYLYGRLALPGAQRTLDTGNAYGQNCLLMYLMDDGSGTTITDYSGNDDHATLANGTWSDIGVTIDADNETISAPMPALSGAFSVMMIFRSINRSGAGPTSQYGKFFVDSGSNRDLQLMRGDADKDLRAWVGDVGAPFAPATDLWDTGFHTIFLIVDDTGNDVCLYVDGKPVSCNAQAIAIPTLGSYLGIGNRVAGTRPLMAIIRAFYMWSVALTAADVASLHADPYQMFTSALDTLYSPCTISWDYEDDSGINGFRVYGSKTPLGFELVPENIICVAEQHERSCVAEHFDCLNYVGVTAFTAGGESELSDTPQFMCGE